MYKARQDQEDLATPLTQLALPVATPRAPVPVSAQRPPVRPPLRPFSFQRSLHNFWHITSPPAPAACTAEPELAMAGRQADTCEDCGVSLNGSDADLAGRMDVDASLDCTDGTAYRCSSCVKVVCFGCSIGDLGAARRCLMCVRS
jgi:hypothetical protein